jgi:hypothetical protein
MLARQHGARADARPPVGALQGPLLLPIAVFMGCLIPFIPATPVDLYLLPGEYRLQDALCRELAQNTE